MTRLYINYRLSFVAWSVILLAIIGLLIGLGIAASFASPLAFLPMVISIILPLGLVLTVSRALLSQDRAVRAAGRQDNYRAPFVIAPPNPAEALPPGATLQMSRAAPPGAIRKAGNGIIALAVILVAINELLVALAFAVPLQPGGENPGWLVWGFAIAPVAIWGGFVAYQYYFLRHEKQVTISADDQGITLTRNQRQRQFMPWDDIYVWIRGVGNSSDSYLSSYALVGYRHRLFLQFNSLFNLRSFQANQALQITYAGGIDYYQAQARQLLATIAARGKAPLRTFPQGFYGPGMRRILPFAQLTTTDIAALPVAHPSLLPSLAAVQAMQMHPGPLALRQRSLIPGNAIVVAALLAAAIALLIFLTPADIAAQDYSALAINVLLPVFLIALVLLRFRYLFNATISVDAQGIRGKVLNRESVIAWQRVRYWVIEPPTRDHPHELIYGLFSDGPTLTWRVPVIVGNDPQSFAQRAYAESFHAMIAARTGQPPRQLPVR